MKPNTKKTVAAALAVVCTVSAAGFGSLAANTEVLAKPVDRVHKEQVMEPLAEGWGVIPKAAEVASKTQEWYQKALPITDGELDVYTEAVDGSNVAGKAYSNTILNVAEEGEVWTKVTSGSLTGYVKTESLATGMDAVERAKTVCPETAKANDAGAELKSQAEPTAETIGNANVESTYTVLEKDGAWIKVQNEGQEEAYVHAEAVTLTRDTKDAMTIEEIEAQKAAQEAAKKAAEEAAAAKAAEEKAAQEAEAARSSVAGVSASTDDQRLLAAIIFCEAGNQPYEGQVAVGAVIMNRVRSGSYPNTIRDVIYQAGQFGPAITGKLDRVLANGSYTDTAMQAASDALAGSNPIGSCLYFGNGNTGLKIGDHYFH